jgi:hypothetical protein
VTYVIKDGSVLFVRRLAVGEGGQKVTVTVGAGEICTKNNTLQEVSEPEFTRLRA